MMTEQRTLGFLLYTCRHIIQSLRFKNCNLHTYVTSCWTKTNYLFFFTYFFNEKYVNNLFIFKYLINKILVIWLMELLFNDHFSSILINLFNWSIFKDNEHKCYFKSNFEILSYSIWYYFILLRHLFFLD